MECEWMMDLLGALEGKARGKKREKETIRRPWSGGYLNQGWREYIYPKEWEVVLYVVGFMFVGIEFLSVGGRGQCQHRVIHGFKFRTFGE